MTIRLHWGIAVAVFYTAFALGTVGFVVFAMRQDVQLVSDDYYARSLTHDAHMAAVANAEALGPALRVDLPADGRGDVVIAWPADMAAAMRGTATLYRPSDAAADRSFAVTPTADGTFRIATTGLAAGRWRLKLQWQASGREYYTERELIVP